MIKHNQRRSRINHQIKESEVQVISADGKMLGTMPTWQALRLAEDQGFDLVEINPHLQPPLARVMDYGKYLYQKEKKGRDHGIRSPTQEVKTIKIGLKTGSHDLEIRANQIAKFLKKGHRVKIELNLRGREKGMVELGKNKLEGFIEIINYQFLVDEPLKRFPGGLGTLIKPGPSKLKLSKDGK